MITFKDGDLLASDCKVICHQVNCQGVMGSGIAKQIRATYPTVYEAYKDVCKTYGGDAMFGCSHFCPIDNGERYIANMFAQYNYGYDGKRYTNYVALRSCLRDVAEKFKGQTVALPFNLGCGRGGGDWNTVLQIIREELGDCDVTIYKLNRG